ncbi:MAG: hypothetical protein F6K19_17375 [Cyanothece sp. SIO1E1]|nr:hypothetical protein [Cyanothece sp. SIO1E1]
MRKLSISNLSWVALPLLLLSSWVTEKKVRCDVKAEVHEIYRIGDDLYSRPSEKAKVKYGPFDGEGNFLSSSESEETDAQGQVNFLAVENSGTIVKYQGIKDNCKPGTAKERVIDYKKIDLKLFIINQDTLQKLQNAGKKLIKTGSYEQLEKLLDGFEKFFPDFREIEDFRGLKDLELDLKERQKSSSTLTPGSLEDLQQRLREQELKRVRTGNPDLERGGNGM